MPPNPLSLKQRLAALSNPPSSPTSPHGQESPRLPLGTRRKPFFNAPWAKRQQYDNIVENGTYGESERVQEVMAKMIFQAGVDFELVLHCSDQYVFHLTFRMTG
jgi:Rho GTPase-activating protein 1